MSEREDAQKITPQIFFDEIVPQILKATTEHRKSVSGTCEIALFGEQLNSWVVDIGQGTVHKGANGKADAYLEMDDKDFKAMMLNRLDWDEAIKAGRIRFDGQLPVLANFAAILEPRTMEY
jgi:putative sterol carrier protein